MESKVQQKVDNNQDTIFNKAFRQVKLSDFINFDEMQDAAEELDEEKKTENFEMTEQEIEALQQILNEKECKVINVEEQADELLTNFADIRKEELDQFGIKFLITLSIVPKYE